MLSLFFQKGKKASLASLQDLSIERKPKFSDARLQDFYSDFCISCEFCEPEVNCGICHRNEP